MDDVRGEVVFAVGDEYLLPEDPEVIPLRHGPRPYLGKVGTGLRLRQVHRARPLAADEFRQVALLDRI